MSRRVARSTRGAQAFSLCRGSWRALASLGLRLTLATLLAGCAMPTHRPGAVRDGGPPLPAGSTPIAQWQQQLGDHVLQMGGGDPAVLSQLPALRAPTTLRPGRIVFAATDIDSVVPERDGFDVFGLLVDKRTTPSQGNWYVFIVGTIERRDFRPVTVAGIRIAAMAVRDAGVAWETGPEDPVALDRYRSSRADAGTTLRFPADHDEFRTFPCGPRVCVEESRSGARWSIDLVPGSPAATAPPEPARAGQAAGT